MKSISLILVLIQVIVALPAYAQQSSINDSEILRKIEELGLKANCTPICGNPTCCIALQREVRVPACVFDSQPPPGANKDMLEAGGIYLMEEAAITQNITQCERQGGNIAFDNEDLTGVIEQELEEIGFDERAVCCWQCGPDNSAACCGYCSQR